VEATSTPAKSNALRTAGYVSLGVGALGVVVGTLGGVVTLNAKSTADSNCPSAGCNADGLDAESRGKTWSTVSTAAFVLGGVALAAGAALVLLTPSSQSAPRAMGGPGALRWTF
jgi:hypothetical protein